MRLNGLLQPGVSCSFAALQTVLTSSLGSSSEEVKAVASQALGGVAIGNLPTYLPFILKQIQSQVGTASLLLSLALTHSVAHCADGTDALAVEPSLGVRK